MAVGILLLPTDSRAQDEVSIYFADTIADLSRLRVQSENCGLNTGEDAKFKLLQHMVTSGYDAAVVELEIHRRYVLEQDISGPTCNVEYVASLLNWFNRSYQRLRIAIIKRQ